MADKSVKEIKTNYNDLKKVFKEVSNEGKKSLSEIDKKAKKATQSAEKLTKSFEDFNKVIEGTTAAGLVETFKGMPNYIKGVSKLTASYSKFTKTAGTAKDMLDTMGISFSQTMKKANLDSEKASKSMTNLVASANKLTSIQDNLESIPKKLREMHEAMGKAPKINTSHLEKLGDLVKGLEGKISDVDFEDIQGKIEKLGKGEGAEKLVESLQKKLKKVQVGSLYQGGEDGKKAVDDLSAELDNLKDLNPGDAMIKSFQDNLKVMKDDPRFSQLMEDNKKEIDEFSESLKKPGVTQEEAVQRMLDLNKLLGPSYAEFFKDFNKSASEVAKEQDDINRGLEKFADKLRKGYNLTFFTDEAVAQFQGVMSQMQASAYELEANNIIPDEQLINAKDMQKSLRNLEELNEQSKKLQEEMLVDEGERERTSEEIRKDQEAIEKAIKLQVRSMKDLERTSDRYSKNMLEASETGFGQKEAEGLSDKLFGISGKLGKLGGDMGEDSPMGKGLRGLSGLAGKFGGKLSKLSFPIGLLTGAIAVSKMLLNLEGRYAAMSSEIVNTGALMGTSAKDVGVALDDLNLKASNMSGLLKAAAGSAGKEFGLARGEILEVVNSLNEAGIPARKLQEQMKGVETTAEGAGNAFLGAANLVTTFSTNLGISKGAVSSMIGEMGYEFGSTMGSIKDTFSEITGAAVASNMSTNRFLATVQTATAGMSLYEEQVRDVAKMVGQLGDKTNLTGAGIAAVSKNVSDFARNTNGLVISISQMSDEQKAGILKTVDAEKKALEAKLKGLKDSGKGDSKEAERLKAQIKLKGKFSSDIKSGKSYEAAGGARFQSPEVVAKLMSFNIAKAMEQSKQGGGFAALEKIAEKYGVDSKVLEEMVSKGVAPEDIAQELVGKMGDPKEQQKTALAIDKKAGNARNKAIDAAKETATILGGKIVPILLGITALIAAGGAGNAVMKLLKGGGGKGGLLSKISGLGGSSVKDLATKGMSGLKNMGGMKGMMSKATNLAKGVGLTATAAFSAMVGSLENVYDMWDKGPTKFANDLDKKFSDQGLIDNLLDPIDSLTVMLSRGTEYLIDKVGGWFDWFGDGEAEKKMAEADKKAAKRRAERLAQANEGRSEAGLPAFKSFDEMKQFKRTGKLSPAESIAPATALTSAVDVSRLAASTNGVMARSAGPTQNTSNTDASNMNNIFNINGGDLNQVKRVVQEAIYKDKRQDT